MPSEATVRTQVQLPLRFADGYATSARVFSFDGLADGREHLAFELGEPDGIPLVRPHSECLTGDVFGSERCDCGPQMREAVERIASEGGYLLYLRQEGRGIGITEKIKAYALQDHGLDTVEANIALGYKADVRDYGVGIQLLKDLGLSKVRLLTNNPKKTDAFIYGGFDLQVIDQVPILPTVHEHNAKYIATKRDKMGHHLPDNA